MKLKSESSTATSRNACFALLLVLAVLSASVASADCTDYAGNQVANCGFEEGDPPSDWTLLWGTDFQRQDTGAVGDHSASAVPRSGNISVWGIELGSACLPAADGTPYRFGAYVSRNVSVGRCYSRLSSFESGDCADETTFIRSPPVTPIADEWFLIEAQGVPAGPYVRFNVFCTTGSPTSPVFLVDEAYAIPLTGLTEVPGLGGAGSVVFALLLSILGVAALTKR